MNTFLKLNSLSLIITVSTLMTISTGLLAADNSAVGCKIEDALKIVQDPNYWESAKKPCAKWPYAEKGQHSNCVACLSNLIIECDDTLKTPMSGEQIKRLDNHCVSLNVKN